MKSWFPGAWFVAENSTSILGSEVPPGHRRLVLATWSSLSTYAKPKASHPFPSSCLHSSMLFRTIPGQASPFPHVVPSSLFEASCCHRQHWIMTVHVYAHSYC